MNNPIDLNKTLEERKAKETYEKVSAENIIIHTVDQRQIPLKPGTIEALGGFVMGESPLDGDTICLAINSVFRIVAKPAMSSALARLLVLIDDDRRRSK